MFCQRRTIWRVVFQLEDQGARYRVGLVRERGDEPGAGPLFPTLLQPTLDTLIRKTHAQQQRMDALITELRATGLLGDEAISRIAEAAAAQPTPTRRLEFWRTERLEIFEAS